MTYTASEFETIVGKMLETHKAKNADYSASGAFGNFRESEKIGVEAWRGAFIRLMDKYSRCVNLIAKGGVGEVKDEALEDTLLDLANYAVIVLCLRQGQGDVAPAKPKLPGHERERVDLPMTWEKKCQ